MVWQKTRVDLFADSLTFDDIAVARKKLFSNLDLRPFDRGPRYDLFLFMSMARAKDRVVFIFKRFSSNKTRHKAGFVL